jgi:hypothetical protein
MFVYRNLTLYKEWMGEYWTRTSLRTLGLVVQLGHPLGYACPHPVKADHKFMLMHTNGLHCVTIQFCHCRGHAPHRVQLLRNSWWPGSTIRPKTAASMDLLRTFQCLNLQGKINATNFYRGLEMLTDGTLLLTIPVCHIYFDFYLI